MYKEWKHFGFVNNNIMASEIELIKKCRNSLFLETGCCYNLLTINIQD